MNFSVRRSSVIVGIAFILAAVLSIIGLVLEGPILYGPDYLTKGAEHAGQVRLGALLELLTVLTVVGTATTMFPILRKYNQTIALWHVFFRFMEAVAITIGIISVLSLLNLGQAFVATAPSDATSFHAAGTVLLAIHDWIFMIGPGFLLGVNTIMYSYIFYKSGLVPKFIPMIGITGSILIFTSSLLILFGVIKQISVWGGLLAIPVAANEMTLAVWLLVKGFNPSVVAALDAKNKANNK